MDYYLEIWLRGYAKDFVRRASTRDSESFHPHVTLARPFNILTPEADIMSRVAEFCNLKGPIPFSIEGKGSFGGRFNHFPIVNAQKLLEFNDGLESALENYVQFAEKLDDKKNLHITVNNQGTSIKPCERIDQYMLRITALRNMGDGNDVIWFSYDFVRQRLMDREESLDQPKWYGTVHMFSEKYGLLPTRNGFKKIAKD